MVGDQDVGLFANRDAYDMFPDNEKSLLSFVSLHCGSKEAANRDRQTIASMVAAAALTKLMKSVAG